MIVVEIIKKLLYSDAGSNLNNAALLLFRILLSTELFCVHGLKKFKVENGKSEKIPNPLQLPEKLNTLVATLADTVVPFLVILGIGTRLVILPVIGVTAIGYFVVHRQDAAAVRDIPYMYTLSFLLLLILGAGTYSLDHYLFNLLQ